MFILMNKTKALIKRATTKLRYGSRVDFKGFQNINFSTHFNVGKNSKIELNKVSCSHNTHFASVNGGHLLIGRQTFFNRNCIVMCRNRIKIGDNCIFGPNVIIYDHNHKFGSEGVSYNSYTEGVVIIERGCWIGAGTIILKDTHIGEGCVIGAGSVVQGKIPSYSLVSQDRKLKILPLENR